MAGAEPVRLLMSMARSLVAGRLAAALVGLLVAGACQGGSPGATGVRGASELRAAQQKLYTGDLEGAEADLRRLAGAGDTRAAADLVLTLAYQHRLDEARATAEQLVRDHPGSLAYGVLARADDWSEDVSGAITAGARAVSLKPLDPVARVFYAEALSDAHLVREADRQLRIADVEMRAQGAGPFPRSELFREWGNLMRARGDNEQAMNYFLIARKLMPGNPERGFEVASIQGLTGQATQAHATVEAALALQPGSPAQRVRAAQVLQTLGDPEGALAQLKKALELAPNHREAALAYAQLLVATRRNPQQDVQVAHDVAYGALRVNPDDLDLRAFVEYLDRLVLRVDPAPELAGLPSPTSPAAGAQVAIGRINRTRQVAGLPALREDSSLDQSATAHAYYVLFNLGRPQLQGTAIVTEDPGLLGFTGRLPLERAANAGAKLARVEELISPRRDVDAAARSWVDSVFHRYPVLSADAEAVGYGGARAGVVSVRVVEIGEHAATRGTDPVVYPADGQTQVPILFDGEEIPTPLPPNVRLPVGYPVSVSLPGGSVIGLSSGRLLDAQGQEVDSILIPPGRGVALNQWSLIPIRPLAPAASYSFEFSGQVDGRPVQQRTRFTTAALAG